MPYQLMLALAGALIGAFYLILALSLRRPVYWRVAIILSLVLPMLWVGRAIGTPALPMAAFIGTTAALLSLGSAWLIAFLADLIRQNRP